MQILLDRRVCTRRGVMNAHQEEAYAGSGPWRLPHSESARDSVVLLPLYHTLTDEEQQQIIGELVSLSRARIAS
jgi:dTDP-4-amino-4,6-dideoxygalactose transaminase